MDKLIAGAILAGGFSTRLKTDKTKLCLHGDTKDMMHHSYACIHEVIQDCWLVCRKGQSVDDLPYINDTHENAGPIAGIFAALTHARNLHYKAVFAISCDMPLLQPAIIGNLLSTWKAAPQNLLTAFLNRRTHKLEMLAAIYNVGALPLFTRAITNGDFRLSAVIPRANTTVMSTDAESEASLFNVNTPEDLLTVRAILAQ